jgi:hypothetical protein
MTTTLINRPEAFWTSRAPFDASPGTPRFVCTKTGVRLYFIPHPSSAGYLAVPGVTSVLSSEQTPEETERLEAWRQRELAAGRDPNAGRERGTRVHSLLEDVIRTGTANPGCQQDADFFSGMEDYIAAYDEFLWN